MHGARDSRCAEFPVRTIIAFLDTVTLVESGKTFGTNDREQERPNLD
jgi:hypothetical protein